MTAPSTQALIERARQIAIFLDGARDIGRAPIDAAEVLRDLIDMAGRSADHVCTDNSAVIAELHARLTDQEKCPACCGFGLLPTGRLDVNGYDVEDPCFCGDGTIVGFTSAREAKLVEQAQAITEMQTRLDQAESDAARWRAIEPKLYVVTQSSGGCVLRFYGGSLEEVVRLPSEYADALISQHGTREEPNG